MATVGDVMRHCRSYFETALYEGEVIVENGRFSMPVLPSGRYVAVKGGSCDGVHLVGDPADVLKDETFQGRVWILSPPVSFLSLCAEISAYDEKNPSGAPQSESFGAYSYSRSTGSGGDSTWRGVFAARLADYQRLTSEVMI